MRIGIDGQSLVIGVIIGLFLQIFWAWVIEQLVNSWHKWRKRR